MEFILAFLPSSLAALSSFLLFLYCLLWISRRNQLYNKRLPPEASGAWPFVGHLPLFGRKKPPHVVLGNLADKYGPIFSIKMGVHRTVIVSSWEMAKDCLTTNDKVFANRPKMLMSEILGYNSAMVGFSPYGPYWRQIRKIATLELLSTHRLKTFKHVRESETKAALEEMYELWDKNKSSSHETKVMLEMKKWFGDIALNVIYRIIVGKRYVGNTTSSEAEEKDPWRDSIRKWFELSGKFVISDAIPSLRWLDLGGIERARKKTAKELDYYVQQWLEEHKRNRASGRVKGDQDFMDVMLSILEDTTEEFANHDADTSIKATCLALIMAASDTTTVTLTWGLSLLLNNRDVLQKAQQELDTHIGRERLPNESDIQNLVYLQAIIKETLRLSPAAAMTVPHESLADCTVGGYHIPAGTRLFVNLWKIHHDPRIWPDPYQFKPERFLTTHKDFDVKGQNFEYIPFGSGRRMCPGFLFASQIMQLTMATLLHGFEISTPSDEVVDLGESFGTANLRFAKLEVHLTPRLPLHLYKQND
ncbi:hypothetical protein Pint_08880 [Pistacia integerrima]|uniref:Uncharacterized protein n=1 Tax=Pistacia integerrima TaxID=434235 RepID=A0ACC0Y0D1_9ROSI|nr:hypothetical protein Pint_08880 [Pistacia integerrima]